jgi:hypothetical protein
VNQRKRAQRKANRVSATPKHPSTLESGDALKLLLGVPTQEKAIYNNNNTIVEDLSIQQQQPMNDNLRRNSLLDLLKGAHSSPTQMMNIHNFLQQQQQQSDI